MKRKRRLQSAEDEDIQSLIDEITIAFEGVQKDPLGSLRCARAADDQHGAVPLRQQRELAARERWSHWRYVPHEDLQRFFDVAFWMKPTDVPFYQAAWMVFTLESLKEGKLEMDWITYWFSPRSSGIPHAKFTPEQRRVTRQFLHFLCTTPRLSESDRPEIDVPNPVKGSSDFGERTLLREDAIPHLLGELGF
jgi:hypothetical protein